MIYTFCLTVRIINIFMIHYYEICSLQKAIIDFQEMAYHPIKASTCFLPARFPANPGLCTGMAAKTLSL